MAQNGLVKAGNIDLYDRPEVKNPDGSVSTVLSFSRGTDDGEVLVPQIVNGKRVSQDQAWQHYLQTGQHLGIFSTPEAADAYATQLHNDYAAGKYKKMASPQTNPFASYSPEDQASIRQQLVSLSSSGQLNEAQKRSVALALTSLGSASGFPSQTLPDNPPPEPPSMWDKANTGLISPDTILKLANLPMTTMNKVTGGKTPKPPTMADLLKMREGSPNDSGEPSIVGSAGLAAINPLFMLFPELSSPAALKAGGAGLVSDTASAMSGFTSPLSLGTMGLAKVAAGTGAASKIAKAILTATGIGFGGKGVLDTAEGVSKGVDTPEGAQQTLGGMAQVAGAAPAVGEIGAAMRGAAQHMVPQAFAEGENALVRTLQPDKKLVPALRDAYRTVAPQLANAPVKDLPDLESFASVQRVNAANQLKTELAKVNPSATRVDPMAVYRNIRGQITRAMELGSPAEAKAIAQYADRVRDSLIQNPMDITQAEQLAQQITARTTDFDKMTPDARRTAAAQGDMTAGEKAFKQSLQDQIEAKLSGYKDLKAQYGSWKEIQNQTAAQMDRQARTGPQATWLQRRGLESILGMGGALFGGVHGGVEGTVGGGLLGYLGGKAAAEMYLNKLASPERMLQRAVNPPTRSPIPFMGQVVQPVASSVAGGGGSAF